MRRAAKVDDNHTEVVKHLRALGWSVVSLAAVGMGCPDLLVGRAGFCALVEVKDGAKPPSARKLTVPQREFAQKWKGPYVVADSPDDAVAKLQGLLLGRIWPRH